MMKYLQKLGKALMLPVACLPICGILMGIGYALAPAAMAGEVNGYVASGAAYTVGFFLIKAGAALIDNMALLFVIGVGVGMADDNDGTAALAALASWLMMTTLLSTGVVSVTDFTDLKFLMDTLLILFCANIMRKDTKLI